MTISNYLENNLIDWLLRGQAFTPPATVYVALFTAAPSDAGGGTEVTGGAYARGSLACSLANFAGTQGEGTTEVSSGTSGVTSNNSAITYPTPSANWGICTHFGVFDAVTGGNLLFYGPLGVTRTISNGDPAPSFPVSTLSFSVD